MDQEPTVYHIHVIHDSDKVKSHPKSHLSERSLTSWSIDGLELVPETEAYDVMTLAPIKNGEEYYLLYAVYSTGDSFGWDRDDSIEFFGIYTNKELAEENMVTLRDSNSHDVMLKRELADGSVVEDDKDFIPWIGWGTSLSYLEVMPLYVTTRPTRMYPRH